MTMNELLDELNNVYRHFVDSFEMTLSVFAKAVDERSRESEGHTVRLADMTARLCRSIGLDEQAVMQARWGAILHDIGTIFIPENILLKTGGLSNEEWKVMRTHPVRSKELLSSVTTLKAAVDIPHYHHEKWDGTGYPEGLKGAEIPLSARIFAVVDVWDALLSKRPYRQPWTEKTILEHIGNVSGIHYDPEVAEHFLRLAQLNEFKQGEG
jgi:response regulator RpfG family c-di-GMP phosphodiesterase